MSIGLFIIRVVVGLTMAAHGGQKLFGWFGGGGVQGTAGAMERLGFRPGHMHASLAGIAELGGGVFLALGLLTPLAGAVLLAVMVAAVGSVHLTKGFFVENGGFEYNLLIAATALGLAFTGPGRYSLDQALRLSWYGVGWGLAALLGGLLAGLAPVAVRTGAPHEAPRPST
ncbi:MAG TPA: DoxX family protein [Polyangia bacterium]|jgi:putative oxidoreductase